MATEREVRVVVGSTQTLHDATSATAPVVVSAQSARASVAADGGGWASIGLLSWLAASVCLWAIASSCAVTDSCGGGMAVVVVVVVFAE
jgi:hypothetical protein